MIKLKLGICVFFCVGIFNQNFSQNSNDIYLIKTAWHVGISLKIDSFTVSKLNVLRYFEKYKFADIGWGDEDFYQNPGINILLGLKALFFPTSSVVRISGIYSDIKYLIDISDFAVKLSLSAKQFSKLLEFIDKSLTKNDDGNYVIASEKNGGQIIFFKSNLKYHAFHTCNTWIAEALNYADLKISKTGIITAQQLYRELRKIGKVLKSPR